MYLGLSIVAFCHSLYFTVTCFSESIKSVSRLMVDGMQVFNQPFMQNNEVLNMIMSVFKKLSTEDLSKLCIVHIQSHSILLYKCTLNAICSNRKSCT